MNEVRWSGHYLVSHDSETAADHLVLSYFGLTCKAVCGVPFVIERQLFIAQHDFADPVPDPGCIVDRP